MITSTARLEVRQFVDDDAPFLHDLHSRPEVFVPLEMEPSAGAAEELRRIRLFRDRFGPTGDFGIWALALLDGPLVGLIMLKPLLPLADHDGMEVGWRLHPDFWGNGHATEGATGLLELAFTRRRLSEVFAVVRSTNERSRAVAVRIGMNGIGTLEYAGLPHELLRIDLDQWQLLPKGRAPIAP